MPEEKKDKQAKDEFFSFEDVLKELKLNEEELNRMVSEGAIRAFRQEDKIKFKKEDINGIKKNIITEPTVILPADELPNVSDISQEQTFVEDTSSLTEEIPFADMDITIPSLEEEKPPEPELPGLEAPLGDQKTFLEEESGLMTAPLEETAGGETISEAFSETVAEVPPALKQPVARPSRRAATVVSRATRLQPFGLPPPRPRVHPVFIIFLAFTFLVLLFVGAVMADFLRISTDKARFPNGVSREVGKLVISLFGIKDKDDKLIDLDQYKP